MSKLPPAEKDRYIAAGPFGAWLSQVRAALRGTGGTDVPCGECVGCCTSSYFIHVRPEESRTIAKVPPGLLFSAPGRPHGHLLLGYSADGSCPMLKQGKCSIYPFRPQTCRDYDCRVFAAAGIDAGGQDKSIINQRIRAWRFTFPGEADAQAHRAVRSATSFICAESASFPGGRVPTAPGDIAVLAIKVYTLFLDANMRAKTKAGIARAVIAASRAFDEGQNRCGQDG